MQKHLRMQDRYPRAVHHGLSATPSKSEVIVKDANSGDQERVFYFSVIEQPPKQGLKAVYETTLHDLTPEDKRHGLQPLAVYRALKKEYGDADRLGRCERGSERSGEIVLPHDWGYVFSLGPSLYLQVYSFDQNMNHGVRVWADSNGNIARLHHNVEDEVKNFYEELDSLVNRSHSVFKVDRSLAQESFTYNPYSVYAGAAWMLQSTGEAFLENEHVQRLFLDISDDDPDPALDEVQDFARPFAIASAILWSVAIEAYVNTIYDHLIKEEYQQEPFLRALKNDFDFKLSTMHIFCNGFSKAPVTPGTHLWKEHKRLRNFRNQALHPTLTEEHKVYRIPEDGNLFHFLASSKSPGVMARVTETFSPIMWIGTQLSEMLSIHANLIEAIKDAMEPDVRREMEKWSRIQVRGIVPSDSSWDCSE